MLTVNKIHTHLYSQDCKQTAKLCTFPVYPDSYSFSKNSNCFIVFRGRNADCLTSFINKKQLEVKLINVLREFKCILNQIEKNNKIPENLLSENGKSLISYVEKKSGKICIKKPTKKNYYFDQIEKFLNAQGINLSIDEKQGLLKRFTLSNNRKLLYNNIIEPLKFFKYSKIFKTSSIIIQNTIDEAEIKIRCFGLSKDVKNIVIKTKKELGVKLDIPNSFILAKKIYNTLAYNKNLGRALPEEISCNDFDFFVTHDPKLSANYISGFKSVNYAKIISKYPALAENFKSKRIDFNPIFLYKRQVKNDYKSIFEDLNHELGHFWHNLKIGDKAFHSRKMNTIDGFLSNRDERFLVHLKNKLQKRGLIIGAPSNKQEKKCIGDFLPSMYDKISNIRNSGSSLKIKIKDKTIKRLNQIIKKLENVVDITKNQFPECPEAVEYALTSPKELIAFAFQRNNKNRYTQEFINLLEKIGFPKKKTKNPDIKYKNC